MSSIQRVHKYLDSLDSTTFHRYSMLFIGVIFIVVIGYVYYLHRTVGALHYKLEEINELRNDKVQSILSRIEHVKQQRTEVNAILAEDEAFKIGGYLNEKLDLLGIANNKKEETATQVTLDNDYRESILSVKFAGLTMKQLTELLNIIEQNKRISTKALEIQRSNKPPRSIDVSLTIATLQPRTAAAE